MNFVEMIILMIITLIGQVFTLIILFKNKRWSWFIIVILFPLIFIPLYWVGVLINGKKFHEGV